jgi:hypothetical protein
MVAGFGVAVKIYTVAGQPPCRSLIRVDGDGTEYEVPLPNSVDSTVLPTAIILELFESLHLV